MRVERYEVRMDFDPPGRTFRGTVEVQLATDPGPMVLYAVDLAVDSVTADGTPARFELDATAQELRIHGLAPGAHTVTIAFAGTILPNGLAGMYVSPFGAGGEILTTQMYPAGTRRFFPCLDVPAAKAEIRMEVGVPKDARVVFNTDPISEVVDGDRKRIRFAPTPRMSTYLLYLGIGPFEETARIDGNLRVIVAHPAGRADAAGFALDHAARFVRAYEAYYAIPYPLPKLHLVAVPSFWAGAMENWGAIAFRETALLVDDRTDAFSRRWNRLVLAHEIAHQWFGNLVTNAWWGDFWLNEAFANFVSYHTVDRVHPGESTWSDFAGREMTRGFSQDALATAHPIEVEIRAPEEIGEIADGITYGKGASILRMIEAYIGEAAFRSGVTAYLNAHRYDAATGADLWSALDAHSDAPVSRIMRAWITKPGHPIVECRAEGGRLVVTQRRYHADGRRDPAHWPVPLALEIDGTTHRTLLEDRPFTVPFPAGARLRVNPERTGFFLTGLDEGLRRAARADWDRCSEIDQWGMLLDAYAQLGSGEVTLEDYLELVALVRSTDRYLPALTASRQLAGLVPFFGAQPKLAETARAFFRQQLDRIGRSSAVGEPETTGVLRNALGGGILRADPEGRRELARQFAENESALDKNLFEVAAAAYVAEGGSAAWTAIRDRIPGAPSDEVAETYAVALAHAQGETEMARTYELLDGPALSASRIWDVLRAANFVPRHAASLWAYYERRLPALNERWKGTPLLSTILPEGLPQFGVGRGDAVRAYFSAHRFPEAERGIAEALERLRVREILARRLGAA